MPSTSSIVSYRRIVSTARSLPFRGQIHSPAGEDHEQGRIEVAQPLDASDARPLAWLALHRSESEPSALTAAHSLSFRGQRVAQNEPKTAPSPPRSAGRASRRVRPQCPGVDGRREEKSCAFCAFRLRSPRSCGLAEGWRRRAEPSWWCERLTSCADVSKANCPRSRADCDANCVWRIARQENLRRSRWSSRSYRGQTWRCRQMCERWGSDGSLVRTGRRWRRERRVIFSRHTRRRDGRCALRVIA